MSDLTEAVLQDPRDGREEKSRRESLESLAEENRRLKDNGASLEIANETLEQKPVASHLRLGEEEEQQAAVLECKHKEAAAKTEELTAEERPATSKGQEDGPLRSDGEMMDGTGQSAHHAGSSAGDKSDEQAESAQVVAASENLQSRAELVADEEATEVSAGGTRTAGAVAGRGGQTHPGDEIEEHQPGAEPRGPVGQGGALGGPSDGLAATADADEAPAAESPESSTAGPAEPAGAITAEGTEEDSSAGSVQEEDEEATTEDARPDAEAQLAAAEQRLAEVEYERTALEDSLADLQEAAESLKSANREMEAKEAAANAEVVRLQAALDDSAATAQVDAGRVEALERALEKAKKTAAADTKGLQDKLSRKEAEASRKDQDLEDMRQRMKGLQQKSHVADALQARVAQLEREMEQQEVRAKRALLSSGQEQPPPVNEEAPDEDAEERPALDPRALEAITAGVEGLGSLMDGHSLKVEEQLQILASRVSSADYRMRHYTEAIHDVVQAKLDLEATVKGLTDRLANSEARCGDQRSAIQALQAQVRSYEEEALTLRNHRLTMRAQVRHWQQEAEHCRREAARNERAARDLHQLEGGRESIDEFFLKRYSSDSLWAPDDFSRLVPTNATGTRARSTRSQSSARPASASNLRQQASRSSPRSVRPSSAAAPTESTRRSRNQPPGRSKLRPASPVQPRPTSAMAWSGPRLGEASLNPEASSEYPAHFRYVMQAQRATASRPNSAAAYRRPAMASAAGPACSDEIGESFQVDADGDDGFIIQEDLDDLEPRWGWSSLPADAFRYGYPNTSDDDLARSHQLDTPKGRQNGVPAFGLGSSVPVGGQRPQSALAVSAAAAAHPQSSQGSGGAAVPRRPGSGERRPATASPRAKQQSSTNMSHCDEYLLMSDRKQRARDLWRDVDLRRTHQPKCRCYACKSAMEAEHSYTELTRDRRPHSFLHRYAPS